MGTKYSQQSASGYNASAPADDGSEVDSNKTKWAHVKDKIGDPLKSLAESIDSALRAHFDEGPDTTSSDYTTTASDFNKVIEVSSGATITLLAPGTAGAGYKVAVKNVDTSNVTVNVDSSGTIDGDSSVTLNPDEVATFMVNNAAGEYLRLSHVPIITTEGDLVIGDSNGEESRLAIGSANRVLRSDGTTASWGQAVSGDVDWSTLSGDITQAAVASSAIGQGELKTTTGNVSVTSSGLNDHAFARRSLPGGQYGFLPEFDAPGGVAAGNQDAAGAYHGWSDAASTHYTLDGDIIEIQVASSFTDPSAATVMLYARDGNNNNTTASRATQRYVQSSPPYDLGDGECGLFVEVAVLSNGLIGGWYVAPDPMWANNGPTDIRPDYIDRKTGKNYKRIRRPVLARADLIEGRCDMADYIAAQKEASVEEVEVTHALKNTDMDVIPHSWGSHNRGTICLLDPVNTHDLLMLHESGEDVGDLIHKGYIQIGGEVKRKGPPGVVPVTYKWRKTR